MSIPRRVPSLGGGEYPKESAPPQTGRAPPDVFQKRNAGREITPSPVAWPYWDGAARTSQNSYPTHSGESGQERGPGADLGPRLLADLLPSMGGFGCSRRLCTCLGPASLNYSSRPSCTPPSSLGPLGRNPPP